MVDRQARTAGPNDGGELPEPLDWAAEPSAAASPVPAKPRRKRKLAIAPEGDQ
jgi:hypothetical protein